MSRVVRIAFFAGIIVFFRSPVISAASSVSPNITGSWAGSATGTDYHDQDNGTGGSTPTSQKVSATLTASITQTDSDLIMSLTVASAGGKTFTIAFTGKVGDFAYWATGVREALGVDDPAANVFIGGHFDKKPSKITGNFILYSGGHVANVTYSLKKTSSTRSVRANPAFAFLPNAGPRDDTTPFNISGSSTGKKFDFSTSAKAVSVKSTITGTIDPVANTATITIVTGTVSETFNVSETHGGKASVNSGGGGSETLLVFGVGSGSSSTGVAGIGWRYSDTGMTEFKYSVKRQ